MAKHFFCGIILEDPSLDAVVINHQGKALLSSHYTLPAIRSSLLEILEQLEEFARFHRATLQIGLCDLSGPYPPFDAHHPDNSNGYEIFTVSRQLLLSTDLPRTRQSASDNDGDAKVVAAICSLMFAQSVSSNEKSVRPNHDPCSF